ncbi:MAG: Hpt domain-containing protein [Gemmatimonadetes bacterium]|nr:Hpt domain-containing protein [Gemmatimonadota bacterium]
MPGPADLTEALARLRARFAAASGETVAVYRRIADELARDPGAADALDGLRREAHKLFGTAGSYGFHEASRLAGALERTAEQWHADPALDRARRAAMVREFADAVASALTLPDRPPPEGPARPSGG